MKPPLHKHILATYFTLRIGIAVIAIAFPLLLWLGGKAWAGIELQNSMSAYYHANVDGRSMRDWFVGILFAVGVFLYLYKGFSRRENYLLNLAGVMAVCVAIFPMEWNCGENCAKYSIHGACAIVFFLAIAYVCVRCSRETLPLLNDEALQARYRRIYRLLATLMLGSPLIAFALNAVLRQYASRVFYVEAVGIVAFAAYWLTKSRELSISQAEARALRGELEV